MPRRDESHRAPGRRVAQGVRDEDVEDPVEVGGRAPDASGAVAAVFADEALVAGARGRRPALGGGRGGRAEVDPFAGELALAGPAEDEQLVDDVGEPVDLAHPGVELGRGRRLRRQRARLLEPQADAAQRRAEMVRGVGDELLLAAQQPRRGATSSR